MKKSFFFTIMCIILLMTGCQLFPHNDVVSTKGSSSMSTSSFIKNETISSNTVTESQLRAKMEEYNQKKQKIVDASVLEVQISYSRSLGGSHENLTINDEKLISRWKNLIVKMDVEARPVVYASGRGFVLDFLADEQTISMGGLMLPYIYGNHEDSTMLYVCNYRDLADEIEQLKKDSGIIQ